MRYQRIAVAWDQFGTSSTGSRCVAPTQTNSDPSIFTADVAKANQLGQVPLLVIGPDIWGATSGYRWPAGVQTPPATPNDSQYKCGVQLLLKSLKSQHLTRAGMPVEAFNEPDNSSYYTDPSQAGRYFKDFTFAPATPRRGRGPQDGRRAGPIGPRRELRARATLGRVGGDLVEVRSWRA